MIDTNGVNRTSQIPAAPILKALLASSDFPFQATGRECAIFSEPNDGGWGTASWTSHDLPRISEQISDRGLGSRSGSCPVAAPGALFFLPLLSEHRRSDPSRDMWPSQYKQTALWGNVYQASSTAIPGHCSRVSGHPLSPPLP